MPKGLHQGGWVQTLRGRWFRLRGVAKAVPPSTPADHGLIYFRKRPLTCGFGLPIFATLRYLLAKVVRAFYLAR